MKLALTFVFAATVVACTVDTTPSKTSSPAGEDEKQEPQQSEPPPPARSDASVPADILGQWTWVTSAGAETFTFDADATYAQDVYVDAHPGDGCGTEYFTHRVGAATFTDTTVTIRSTEARRKKVDSCSDETLADDAIDPQDETFTWHRTTDEQGLPVLVLERSGEPPTTYAAGSR